jgi:hypothetical protein
VNEMTKQPTRLSNFQIPRGEASAIENSQAEQTAPPPVVSPSPQAAVGPSAPLAIAAMPLPPGPVVPAAPTIASLPQAEAPTEIPRRALGARVPVALAERLRAYLYVSRRSQQEVVEAALDAYLRERGA